MLALSTTPANPSLGRFATPPRDGASLPWQLLDHRLPAEHLARVIDQAANGLGLTGPYTASAGRGSLPHPPALLLQAVPYELQNGRRRPAQWHRDAAESGPLRWPFRGCRPSRSAW